MVICCNDCYPHCDFCIHSKRHYLELNKERVKVVVEGCKLHFDEHHQSMAINLGYCKDFHCLNMKEKEEST